MNTEKAIDLAKTGVAVAALLLGGAGAVSGYNAGQKMDKLEAKQATQPIPCPKCQAAIISCKVEKADPIKVEVTLPKVMR